MPYIDNERTAGDGVATYRYERHAVRTRQVWLTAALGCCSHIHGSSSHNSKRSECMGGITPPPPVVVAACVPASTQRRCSPTLLLAGCSANTIDKLVAPLKGTLPGVVAGQTGDVAAAGLAAAGEPPGVLVARRGEAIDEEEDGEATGKAASAPAGGAEGCRVPPGGDRVARSADTPRHSCSAVGPPRSGDGISPCWLHVRSTGSISKLQTRRRPLLRWPPSGSSTATSSTATADTAFGTAPDVETTASGDDSLPLAGAATGWHSS